LKAPSFEVIRGHLRNHTPTRTALQNAGIALPDGLLSLFLIVLIHRKKESSASRDDDDDESDGGVDDESDGEAIDDEKGESPVKLVHVNSPYQDPVTEPKFTPPAGYEKHPKGWSFRARDATGEDHLYKVFAPHDVQIMGSFRLGTFSYFSLDDL